MASAQYDLRPVPRWVGFYTWSLVIVVLLPIVVVIPVSFNVNSSLSLPTEGLSLRWYASVFGDLRLINSFLLSVIVALGATLISLILGTLAAYAIARYELHMLDVMLLAPIAFPAVVLGGALLMVLAPLGYVRTLPGLLLAHSVVTLPYVVRTMVATIRGIDTHLEEAALILGADRFRIMSRIVLPLAMPGLISAASFAFIISFDEFSVSLFLVGTNVMTLPLEMYQRIQFVIDPTVAAASTLLVVISGLLVFAVERLVGLQRFFVGQ